MTQCHEWMPSRATFVLKHADLDGATLFDWWNVHIAKVRGTGGRRFLGRGGGVGGFWLYVARFGRYRTIDCLRYAAQGCRRQGRVDDTTVHAGKRLLDLFVF